MPRWLTGLLLILILAVAAVTRFVHIQKYCYFFDEAWNDELTLGRGSIHIQLPNDIVHENVPKPTSLAWAQPWWCIWSNMHHVTHPPLYFIVLRWWREIFGESILVSRAFSVTVALLAILAMFDITRLLHGTTAALWTCAIMALAGVQIELAQETRSYAMLLAISLAALAALVRIEKLGPTKMRLFALGTAVLGMVLTHYFASAAALAIGVYVMVRLPGRARRDAMTALLIAAMIFAVCWGPFMWRQREYFTVAADTWMREASTGHVLGDLRRLAEVPIRLLIEPPRHTFPAGYVAAILLPLPFILAIRRREMLLWCVWLCGTIFFIAAIDIARSTQHLAYIRYSLLGSPAIYATIVTMIPPTKRWLHHAVPACIVLACACALPEAWEVPKPEFRQFASYLDNNVRPGDVVVFYTSADEWWFCNALYLNTAYHSRSYPWPFVMLTHPPDEALLEKLKQFKSIWLVTRSDQMRGVTLMPDAKVDGYQFFPYVCQCERVTPRGRGG